MARAYICFARADMADSGLQVLDLRPNSSQPAPYDGAGQTCYITHLPQNDTVATTAAQNGSLTTNAAYKGLAAYLMDNVENVDGQNNNKALTAVQANAIALNLLARVVNGQSMTLANINGTIQMSTGGGNADLTGVAQNSNSTGSVEGVLRILSGEVYRLPAGSAVAGAAGVFPVANNVHAPLGMFLVSGDAGYRSFRKVTDTGALQLSAQSGHLSKLKDSSFVFVNPALTYGNGGTALTVYGDAINANHAKQAVLVYDASGNLI